MDRVYLSWTIENWITVVLMAVLGYLVFALAGQFILARTGAGSAPANGNVTPMTRAA